MELLRFWLSVHVTILVHHTVSQGHQRKVVKVNIIVVLAVSAGLWSTRQIIALSIILMTGM